MSTFILWSTNSSIFLFYSLCVLTNILDISSSLPQLLSANIFQYHTFFTSFAMAVCKTLPLNSDYLWKCFDELPEYMCNVYIYNYNIYIERERKRKLPLTWTALLAIDLLLILSTLAH